MAGVFERANTPLFLVGGAVRNPLMGLPISDVDVCGPATPHEVLSLCEGTDIHAHLRAAHFGTVELRIADADGTRHMAEYTTFREDSYRCGHQPSEVRFAKSLSVDALRRDFSVNALYLPVVASGAGEVNDPTGGLEHLRMGVLHTVTADPDQVLKDDGLRILRAVRFQAELGLMPTKELLASAARFAPLLGDIAPERLRDEFVKVLTADFRYGEGVACMKPPQKGENGCHPIDTPDVLCSNTQHAGADSISARLSCQLPSHPSYFSVLSGLRTLVRIGAWEFLFPDLAYEESGAGAIERLEVPSGVSVVAGRLALLFWKADAEPFRESLRALCIAERETGQAVRLLEGMQRLMASSLAEPLSVFEAAKLGLPVLTFTRNAFVALVGGKGEGNSARAEMRRCAAHAEALIHYLSKGVPLSLRELAINGNDLKPVMEEAGCPFREMGALLDYLWECAVERTIANEREALLSVAASWARTEVF